MNDKGFTLVEVLLAVALLALVLVPTLGAFRAQLISIQRTQSKEWLELALANSIVEAESLLDIRRDAPGPRSYRYNQIHVVVELKTHKEHGDSRLWGIEARATDERTKLEARASKLIWTSEEEGSR